MINFNQTGDLVAIVSIAQRKRNKIFKFSRVEELFYVKVLSIIQLKKKEIREGFITPLLTDTKLLMDYYSEKMVRSIDFLGESGEVICLVFDDEILTLKITGGNLRVFCRIGINSEVMDKTFYWDVYKDAYVFGKGLSIRREGSTFNFRCSNAEFIEGDEIVEAIEKMHLNQTTSLDEEINGKMSFEFQYQLMEESD